MVECKVKRASQEVGVLTRRPLERVWAPLAVGSNLLRAQKVGNHMPPKVDEVLVHTLGYRKLVGLTKWFNWYPLRPCTQIVQVSQAPPLPPL